MKRFPVFRESIQFHPLPCKTFQTNRQDGLLFHPSESTLGPTAVHHRLIQTDSEYIVRYVFQRVRSNHLFFNVPNKKRLLQKN